MFDDILKCKARVKLEGTYPVISMEELRSTLHEVGIAPTKIGQRRKMLSGRKMESGELYPFLELVEINNIGIAWSVKMCWVDYEGGEVE